VHSLDAVNLLFEGDGDGRFNNLSVGAHVITGDAYLGRRKIWIERDGKLGNGHGAGQNDQQSANCCEYRPSNEKVDQVLTLLTVATPP